MFGIFMRALRAQNSDGNWVVPIFNRNWNDNNRRNLNLYNLDNKANPDYGWLVLRQQIIFHRL